jgi:hypothetical protein
LEGKICEEVEKPSTNKQTNKQITFIEAGNEWVRVILNGTSKHMMMMQLQTINN